jgi:hypothetical protein
MLIKEAVTVQEEQADVGVAEVDVVRGMLPHLQ